MVVNNVLLRCVTLFVRHDTNEATDKDHRRITLLFIFQDTRNQRLTEITIQAYNLARDDHDPNE